MVSELINLTIKADIWSVIFYADPVEGSTTVDHLLSFAHDNKKNANHIRTPDSIRHIYIFIRKLLQVKLISARLHTNTTAAGFASLVESLIIIFGLSFRLETSKQESLLLSRL